MTLGLRLGFAGCDGIDDVPHLSVDGMTPTGPNLSHWPGNRTPREFKADLSTGICLRFARADDETQRAFLGDAEVVLNDHYDTDGFLSLLAVLDPDLAFANEEVLLAAAGTGDFQRFHTERAFAIDRIVAHLADPERSPLAEEFADLAGPDKSLARYRWLLRNAQHVLTEPESLSPLYEAELARVTAELDGCVTHGWIDRAVHHAAGLAVLRSDRPLHRMVLNTLAGAWRVLHAESTRDGTLYRYHDRTESWFEVVTFAPPGRRDLRPIAAALAALEGEPHGDGSTWHADAPTEPIPELYHGPPGAQAYGQVTRRRTPSRLAPDVVERVLVESLAETEPAA